MSCHELRLLRVTTPGLHVRGCGDHACLHIVCGAVSCHCLSPHCAVVSSRIRLLHRGCRNPHKAVQPATMEKENFCNTPSQTRSTVTPSLLAVIKAQTCTDCKLLSPFSSRPQNQVTFTTPSNTNASGLRAAKALTEQKPALRSSSQVGHSTPHQDRNGRNAQPATAEKAKVCFSAPRPSAAQRGGDGGDAEFARDVGSLAEILEGTGIREERLQQQGGSSTVQEFRAMREKRSSIFKVRIRALPLPLPPPLPPLPSHAPRHPCLPSFVHISFLLTLLFALLLLLISLLLSLLPSFPPLLLVRPRPPSRPPFPFLLLFFLLLLFLPPPSFPPSRPPLPSASPLPPPLALTPLAPGAV